jgi:hypothetical protein
MTLTANCATIPPCGMSGEPRFHQDWPPLIKMDEAVKAKVEKTLGML